MGILSDIRNEFRDFTFDDVLASLREWGDAGQDLGLGLRTASLGAWHLAAELTRTAGVMMLDASTAVGGWRRSETTTRVPGDPPEQPTATDPMAGKPGSQTTDHEEKCEHGWFLCPRCPSPVVTVTLEMNRSIAVVRVDGLEICRVTRIGSGGVWLESPGPHPPGCGHILGDLVTHSIDSHA